MVYFLFRVHLLDIATLERVFGDYKPHLLGFQALLFQNYDCKRQRWVRVREPSEGPYFGTHCERRRFVDLGERPCSMSPRGGTTASRDRHKLLTHQAFAKAISIHFLSRCFETSCVSREAFLACL